MVRAAVVPARGLCVRQPIHVLQATSFCESVIIYKLADVRGSHINLVAEVAINTTCWLFGFTIIFLRCRREVRRLGVVR